MTELIVPPLAEAEGIVRDCLTAVDCQADELAVLRTIVLARMLFHVCGLTMQHDIAGQVFPCLLTSMLSHENAHDTHI